MATASRSECGRLYGASPPELVTPAELVARWRAQAAEYERDRQPAAAVLERVAGELEAALARRDDEILPLPAAAAACGYSVAHLRRLVTNRQLENVSPNGRVLVRRGDLPRKPGARPGPDLVGVVLPGVAGRERPR